MSYSENMNVVNMEPRWICYTVERQHLSPLLSKAWQGQQAESVPADDIDTVMLGDLTAST
jgi:hypothetical protein